MAVAIQNFAVSITFLSALCNAQPLPPTGLNVVSYKSDQLTISWTDSTTPGVYHKIYVGTTAANEADAFYIQCNPYKANYAFNGVPLFSNTQYNVAVYAMFIFNNSIVSDALDGNGTTVFSAPFMVNSTISTTSSIELSWIVHDTGGGAATITGYNITYMGGSGGTQVVTDPSATSATISPLDSNTAYSFTIAVISSAGTGDLSNAQSGTTSPDKVVLAANTTTATIDTIGLNWIPVSGEVPVNYTVTWIPPTSGGSQSFITGNSTTVGGLIASTQYIFQVFATNSDSSGELSDSALYYTLPNASAAPSLLSGSDATNTIVVSWTAPSGGNDIVDYVVEWTGNSATSTKVATGTSTTLTSLTPGELYSVNVKARNSAGAGTKSNDTLYRTNPPMPMGVTLMQPTSKNSTILIVSWTMPATYFVVSFYVITLTPSSGDPDGTHTVTYPATTNSPTTYTLGGLTPAQSYVANVQAVSNDTAGEVSDASPSLSTSTCPFECEGCIGPCSLSSTGGCDCSCIDGYFPTQLDCQPVVCKEETLVHPTLLINVTFPSLQGGFQSSSLETCDNQTVNGGKPYGTRSCLLNGTSTTPIWLTSCDRGIQNIANVTITSTEKRVAVANDLEVLTSNPESLSSDDVTNTVQALDNLLDVPSITPEVSLSAVTVVSNMLNVPDDVFVASTGTERLLTAIESVGMKVELDWNGVYEAVTSNVGIAAIQPAVGTDIMRSAFGVDNLPTNSDLGFRSDQVHLFGSGAPDNVTGYISVPNNAALNNLGTSKRISFLAFSNDKLFISSKGKYDDVNSVVFLSATIGQTSVTNLIDPVIVQLRTNMTLNNGSDDRLSSSCVFWDEGNQSWTNGDVDSKIQETFDSVVCHFNHLTNFATLLV